MGHDIITFLKEQTLVSNQYKVKPQLELKQLMNNFTKM